MLFRRGKRASRAIQEFEYHLEEELQQLSKDTASGTYRHSPYTEFLVNDTKRRVIAVATVRDRVVHRLLYEYLVRRYDKTFAYDVWSCRPDKGLDGAVTRVQQYMQAYQDGWLWRSDVRKFFDHVDHEVLMRLVRRRVSGVRALALFDTVVSSYSTSGRRIGLAIGNLTSQICANIYLHEYDRFVSHTLKPLGYVRYGDDMVLWVRDEQQARAAADQSKRFLADILHLELNPGSTVLQPTHCKLHYVGVEFWPSGHRLDARMRARLKTNVSLTNFASYDALAAARGTPANRRMLRETLLCERLDFLI